MSIHIATKTVSTRIGTAILRVLSTERCSYSSPFGSAQSPTPARVWGDEDTRTTWAPKAFADEHSMRCHAPQQCFRARWGGRAQSRRAEAASLGPGRFLRRQAGRTGRTIRRAQQKHRAVDMQAADRAALLLAMCETAPAPLPAKVRRPPRRSCPHRGLFPQSNGTHRLRCHHAAAASTQPPSWTSRKGRSASVCMAVVRHRTTQHEREGSLGHGWHGAHSLPFCRFHRGQLTPVRLDSLGLALHGPRVHKRHTCTQQTLI